MSWVTITILAMLPLMALGVALMWFGLRGKQLDKKPNCRQCGLDLSETPEDVLVCPKCRAALRPKAAVRIGHWQRQRWAIALGAVCAVVAAVLLGQALLNAAFNVNWNKYKPTSWLLKNVTTAQGKDLERSTELGIRLEDGRVGGDEGRRWPNEPWWCRPIAPRPGTSAGASCWRPPPATSC